MQRIKYYFNNPFNKGTEESPEWVDNLLEKSMPYSEANEEIAKAEAYNGEYTVEDDGQPEPEIIPTVEERVEVLEETSATKDEVQAVWDSMAAAYNEGVQNA